MSRKCLLSIHGLSFTSVNKISYMIWGSSIKKKDWKQNHRKNPAMECAAKIKHPVNDSSPDFYALPCLLVRRAFLQLPPASGSVNPSGTWVTHTQLPDIPSGILLL